ncbi:MAG: TldD/PmbA family protein, partial [Methanobacteriota archaeon]
VRSSGGIVCDVLVLNARATTAEIEKNSIKQASFMDDPGIAIRVFDRGSLGFAYCTSHDIGDVSRAAEMAVSQARGGTADDDFKGLPLEGEARHPIDLYDESLAELRPDEAVDLIIDASEEATSDSRISSVNASLIVATNEVALANSNGLVANQKLTAFDVTVEAVARFDGGMFSGLDFVSGRKLDRDASRAVGSSAMRHALDGLRHAKVETQDCPVVLDPLAASWIFASSIGGGVNAENVQRGRSFLAGRLGSDLAYEGLTVNDDPTVPWGFGSMAFDGEGVPTRPKAVIDRGVLSTYLHDSYTAGKDSLQSTGNSSRGGTIWTFRQPPDISFSNLVVTPGDASTEEMIRDCGDGVYLRLTFDHPNLATGEFSALMMEGYIIENGEIGPSVRQSTLGLNMTELLSRIDLIGSEPRQAFGVVTPALRISKARIGGSG